MVAVAVRILQVSWSTKVLLVLAVLLTLWATIVEPERTSGFAGPGSVFPRLKAGSIVELEIRYQGEDAAERVGAEAKGNVPGRILARRVAEHRWEIRDPVVFPGFLPRLEGLTWALAELVLVDRIEAGTEAWERALPEEGPGLVVRFETRQGAEHRIEFGRDHPEPTLDYMYIRVDGEAVRVVRKDLRRTFAVGLDDLRSRALFPIAAVDCVRVSIENVEEEVRKTMARPGPGTPWKLVHPESFGGMLADRKRVEEMLDELNSWGIARFEVDGDDELSSEVLARWGLAPPVWRIDARHADGDEVRLDIGRPVESDGDTERVAVRFRDRPFIFSADASVLEYLRVAPELFRTEYVFDFRGAELRRLVCRGPEGGFAVERTEESLAEPESSGEEREGRQAPRGRRARQPAEGDEGEEPPRWVIRDLESGEEHTGDERIVGIAVAELRELMIQEFLEPVSPGAELPGYDRSVEVTLETGRQLTLRLGPRSEDPRDREFPVYRATRSTDRSRFLVETYWPQRIDTGFWVFRDRAISGVGPVNLFELEVRAGSDRWTLYRVPGQGWGLPGEVELLPGRSLDQDAVTELVEALSRERFRVREFAPGLPATEYDYWGIGRTDFRHQVRLTHVVGSDEGFRRLTVGHEKPDSEPLVHYARADRPSVPFLITDRVPRKLATLVDHLREITGAE